MAKRSFVGEKQNLPQLAEDVAAWLRQQGFDVQSGTGPNAYFIQARKQSTWRAMLGNNQSIDVKIEGTPNSYTIEVDGGQWVKNLTSSGPSAVVAALATVYTLGIAAAWSASERSTVEENLWALKDASCPECCKVGAARHTGEKFVRVEGVTLLPTGDYQGVKVFADTYRCKFCPHSWDREKQPRTVTLCPKCHLEGAKEAAGEDLFSTKRSDRRSQDGHPLVEQLYTNTFRCRGCGHSWNDGQKCRSLEACPECFKPGTRQAVGQAVTALWKTEKRRSDGLPLAEQVFTNNFRCGECGCQWNDGVKTRSVAVCPKCSKARAGADAEEVCRCAQNTLCGTALEGALESLYGRSVSGAELQIIDAFECLCARHAAAQAVEDRAVLVRNGYKSADEVASLPLNDGSVVSAYKPDDRWTFPRVTDNGELLIAVQAAGLLFRTKTLFWKTGKGAVPQGELAYADIDLKAFGCRQGTFGHALILSDRLVIDVGGTNCGAGLMASITVFLGVAARLAKAPVEGDWKECFTLTAGCPKCKTAIQVTGESLVSALCPTCSTSFTPVFGRVAWGSVVADGLWGVTKGIGTAIGVAAVGTHMVMEAMGAFNCRHCGQQLNSGHDVCPHCGRQQSRQ